MKKQISILHLEDDLNDAELIAMQLRSDQLSCVIECVKSEKEFSASLDRGGFDLILADNTGPTFSGYTALAMAKKAHPLIPFIVVSGAGDTKDASKVIQAGASGYVLKHRLADLAPAIRGALKI